MICILIPALNEEHHLRALLPSIPRQLFGRRVTVMVVSDGSTDRTREVVGHNGGLYAELGTNQGKGAALRAGLSRAFQLDFDYLVTMDADGQHDPRDLAPLLEPVLTGRSDACFGSRYLVDRGRGATPLNRYLVRKMAIVYLRQVLGRTYTDPFCGYRCWSRAALEKMSLVGNGYHCELEAIFDVAMHGLRIEEVAVRRIYGGDTSRMGCRGGPLAGRVRVVAQYLEALKRKSRELRIAGLVPGQDTDTRKV